MTSKTTTIARRNAYLHVVLRWIGNWESMHLNIEPIESDIESN